MTKPTKIFIIRHGQTTYNEQNRVSGHVDPPLTKKGREQIVAARQKLQHIKFDVAYSSDLQRAADTAEILIGEPIREQNKIAELRERYYGELEGKDGSLLDEGQKLKMNLPAEEIWHYKNVPDMESDYEIATRFTSAIENIAIANPSKTVLIAAHGTAIRMMLIMLENLTHKDMPSGSIDNGGFVELSYSDAGLEVVSLSELTLKA